ncbi:MAG: hydrogenase iron-sulfur subunit [Deltaproteobacteria bacterium]|nr:hydrogenase iron-sulfur subunit [Deltaproteobacteria bacterium]
MPKTADLRLIGFLCDHCAYAGADEAGRAGKAYPASFKIVRLPCSGRLDPQWVLLAFREGADGVLVAGCHPGDCHYREGNQGMLKSITLLRRVLVQLGLAEARLRVLWISAREGETFARRVTDWAEEIQVLGPRGAGR